MKEDLKLYLQCLHQSRMLDLYTTKIKPQSMEHFLITGETGILRHILEMIDNEELLAKIAKVQRDTGELERLETKLNEIGK